MAETPLIGAVLCGGQSRRFGSDKALADAGGRALGTIVVEALRDAGADPVVAIGGSAGGELGIPTVPDRHPGAGPLAALATALNWAGAGRVLVAPCDLPRLRGAHVTLLVDAAPPGVAAVALVDGRPQPSLGCWPAGAGPDLLQRLRLGHRAWRDALNVVDWVGVDVPPEAMADADTPEDLAALVDR